MICSLGQKGAASSRPSPAGEERRSPPPSSPAMGTSSSPNGSAQAIRSCSLRTTIAFCNEKIEIYVAKDLIPSHQHLDEGEYVDVKAYTMEELKEMIFTGKIEDSKTIAALLAYESKYLK